MKRFLRTINGNYVSISHINSFWINEHNDIMAVSKHYNPTISQHSSKEQALKALHDLVSWIEQDENEIRWE